MMQAQYWRLNHSGIGLHLAPQKTQFSDYSSLDKGGIMAQVSYYNELSYNHGIHLGMVLSYQQGYAQKPACADDPFYPCGIPSYMISVVKFPILYRYMHKVNKMVNFKSTIGPQVSCYAWTDNPLGTKIYKPASIDFVLGLEMVHFLLPGLQFSYGLRYDNSLSNPENRKALQDDGTPVYHLFVPFPHTLTFAFMFGIEFIWEK